MKAVASLDPDELLIEELLRPPPLEQARASLEFWQRRRSALPAYRMRARRETKDMIRRCRTQVAAAERARYGTGLPGLVRRMLAGEPFPWRFGRMHVLQLALRIRPRRIVDVAAVCVLVVVAVVLLLQLV